MFTQSWDDFESGITVYVEADENAAYAYLFINREFKSMVWLYNTSETPDIPDWVTKINHGNPCRNSSEFVYPQLIFPDDPPYDLLVVANLHVTIETEGNHQIEIGIIAPDEKSIQLLAILRDDQKLGWSRNASKDNSIAKSLEKGLLSKIIPSSCWINGSNDDKGYRILEMTR